MTIRFTTKYSRT